MKAHRQQHPACQTMNRVVVSLLLATTVLFANLGAVVAFQPNSNRQIPMIIQKHHATTMTPFNCNGSPTRRSSSPTNSAPVIPLSASNSQEPELKNINRLYNDDSFGLTWFVAGFATKDITFAAVFAGLTIAAAAATRLGVLPMDWKYPKFVDRKVPGVIAALTLLLTPIASDVLATDFHLDPSAAAGVDPSARSVQLAICSFSMVTAFFDIRWRDTLEKKD